MAVCLRRSDPRLFRSAQCRIENILRFVMKFHLDKSQVVHYASPKPGENLKGNTLYMPKKCIAGIELVIRFRPSVLTERNSDTTDPSFRDGILNVVFCTTRPSSAIPENTYKIKEFIQIVFFFIRFYS